RERAAGRISSQSSTRSTPAAASREGTSKHRLPGDFPGCAVRSGSELRPPGQHVLVMRDFELPRYAGADERATVRRASATGRVLLSPEPDRSAGAARDNC